MTVSLWQTTMGTFIETICWRSYSPDSWWSHCLSLSSLLGLVPKVVPPCSLWDESCVERTDARQPMSLGLQVRAGSLPFSQHHFIHTLWCSRMGLAHSYFYLALHMSLFQPGNYGISLIGRQMESQHSNQILHAFPWSRPVSVETPEG